MKKTDLKMLGIVSVGVIVALASLNYLGDLPILKDAKRVL